MKFLIFISFISCDKIILQKYFTLNTNNQTKIIINKEKILLSKINPYTYHWQFFLKENNFLYMFDIYIHTKFMDKNIFFIMNKRITLTKYKNNYQITNSKEIINSSLNNKINNIIYDNRNYKNF